MIKLELYRAFGAVAEAGSISAAAQRLYLSQPHGQPARAAA